MFRSLILFCLFFLILDAVKSQTISTYAGGGTNGLGDGGPADSAQLGYFAGIAIAKNGDVFIADPNHNRIRKVNAITKIITTVAGSGVAGFNGDGGLATNAQLNTPTYVAVDNSENIYISDPHNHRIRKVDTNGIISTFAGDGQDTILGDGGLAVLASIGFPQGICTDYLGNIYIASSAYPSVRKIDTAGIISTVAGDGISGYGGDGGPATLAELRGIFGIKVDSLTNSLYIADMADGRVRKVDLASGIISTIAGTGTNGFSGDGGPAISAQVGFPMDIAIDKAGNIFIADDNNNRVRKIDSNGIITTVAGIGVAGFDGDGGLAGIAKLNRPEGVAFDPCGNLYIADQANKRVRKVIYDSICSPIDTTTNVQRILTITEETYVYPNPAKERLTVTGGNDVKDVMVLNTIGQVLIEQRNYGNKAMIDVSALSTGIYLIKITDKKGATIVRRFLKE